MKQKPLFFIILGILHLLEPFSKLLFFKFSTDFSLFTILNNVFSMGDPVRFFEFWFLFPLGGIALISVKNWSYPVFYLVQCYSFYSHLSYQSYSWPYLAKTPFWSSLTLLLINLALMAYFLLPKMRKPFLDRRFRWWETNQRYNVSIPAFIQGQNGTSIDVKLENISLTGCLIIGELEGQVNEPFVNFEVLGVKYKLRIVKSRSLKFQGVSSIGFSFLLDKADKNKLRKLIKCLKLMENECSEHSVKNIETLERIAS